MILKKSARRLTEIISLKIDIHLLEKNLNFMSHTCEMDDDLLLEYEFTQLTVVDRGEGRNKSNITPEQMSVTALK